MGNKKSLNAYVRYDGTGRVVSSGNILQRFKPKDGNWKQIGAYECCDPSCLPPVYGEDFIIDDIIPQPEGLVIIVETNPFTNPTLQVSLLSCDSDVPSRTITLDITTIAGNVYYYYVPDSIVTQSCGIAFRRVCTDTVSGWTYDSGPY